MKVTIEHATGELAAKLEEAITKLREAAAEDAGLTKAGHTHAQLTRTREVTRGEFRLDVTRALFDRAAAAADRRLAQLRREIAQ